MFIVKSDKMYIAKTRKSPVGPTPFQGFLQFVLGVGELGGSKCSHNRTNIACQKAKTMLVKNLEGQTRCIMGNEKVANRIVGIVALKISLQDSYKRGHPILAAISMFS